MLCPRTCRNPCGKQRWSSCLSRGRTSCRPSLTWSKPTHLYSRSCGWSWPGSATTPKNSTLHTIRLLISWKNKIQSKSLRFWSSTPSGSSEWAMRDWKTLSPIYFSPLIILSISSMGRMMKKKIFNRTKALSSAGAPGERNHMPPSQSNLKWNHRRWQKRQRPRKDPPP